MEHTLLDRSRYNLELVNGWFIAADSKTSASCGIVSVVVAVLVYVAENLLSKLLTENGIDGNWKMLFMFSAISAVLTFILSVFFHIWALSPSFLSESNNKTNTMKPIIFFEDIREFKNVTEYIEVAKKLQRMNILKRYSAKYITTLRFARKNASIQNRRLAFLFFNCINNTCLGVLFHDVLEIQYF